MECESTTCNIYEAIDKLFAGEQQAQPAAVVDKLRETFPHSVRTTWPSVNSAAASGWKDGVMIRARCMIQDALGSEFYAASCELTKGDAKRVASGVLRDSFGDEEVTETLEHAARHCYVMVPIPGATEWYTRQFDGEATDGSMDMKRLKLEPAATQNLLERFVAKFIDDSAEELRVNTVFEVYGVLSGHNFGDEQQQEEMDEGEQEACSSPTNLPGLPNLHVIHYEQVVGGAPEALFSSLPPPSTILPQLRSLMVECVGDELAADYLVMHLMSSTYARADNATICALPLNVCGVKEAKGMEEIMKALAAKVKTLPLTSSSLSTSPFHSIKCYKTNRLQQGELQLADGTHLLIDETVTPKGKIQVGEHASANLGTLGKVISEQKIEYEFGFYRCPFEVDVPVMVLSEERSRYVATPFRLCLPSGPSPSVDPINRLSSADLLALRLAILRAKSALKDVVVSGDVAKAIQEDFVRMCADPSTGIASDEKANVLSQLLIVTRLVCVLRGHAEMSIYSWKVAVLMEKRREEELNARFPLAPTEADFAAENKEN